MSLSKAQESLWNRAHTASSGGQGVALSPAMSAYLVARIAADLGLLDQFPEIIEKPCEFFEARDPRELVIEGVTARPLFERLVSIVEDSDVYFACIASLQRARLKYNLILTTQPMPSLEQVGPRGLLQYGWVGPEALTSFLFWRKWFFDIDNRAGQETGYLFEPIIAHAIGGIPVPSSKSPVRRHRDDRKGRQVDCIRGQDAYEFKIRVTIAASGQGRWGEELEFPVDCRVSGYRPVLVCLDSTPNPKLADLQKAFLAQGGAVFVGEAAWGHLEEVAGETMSAFLERYVREPLSRLLESSTGKLLPMTVDSRDKQIVLSIGAEIISIERHERLVEEEGDPIPEDAEDELFG